MQRGALLAHAISEQLLWSLALTQRAWRVPVQLVSGGNNPQTTTKVQPWPRPLSLLPIQLIPTSVPLAVYRNLSSEGQP